MKYVVEDYFLQGIPQTILSGGLASRGIACHWTAGRTGRAGAIETANYFVRVASTRNASYHELWWWDSATRTFGVLRIVPATRAAHSMNPRQPKDGGPWNPNALVREILGDKWWNPNSYSYAVSFAGMPNDLAIALQDPWFVECATRRIRELLAQETTITHPRPLFNHGEGQPNKYDWGPDFRPAIYGRLFALPDTSVPEEDMDLSSASHQIPKIVRIKAGQDLRRLPKDDSQLHWHSSMAFEAELLFGLDGWWACRRTGAGAIFYVKPEALDPDFPNRRFVDPATIEEQVEGARAEGVKQGADVVLEAAKTAASKYGVS